MENDWYSNQEKGEELVEDEKEAFEIYNKAISSSESQIRKMLLTEMKKNQAREFYLKDKSDDTALVKPKQWILYKTEEKENDR